VITQKYNRWRDYIVLQNTTHGSGWMFQVQPTTEASPDYVVIFLFLAFARKRIKTGEPRPCLCRSDLKYPPTPVGGISLFSDPLPSLVLLLRVCTKEMAVSNTNSGVQQIK